MRVLIADDEPLAIARLRNLCARIGGIEVVGAASDGAAALDDIRSLRPDIVLLDVTMPGLDGIAVARTLRGMAHAPSVVFVTAHDHFAVLAFELEAADYLLKPVEPDRLAQALRRVRPSPADPAAPEAEIWVSRQAGFVRLDRNLIDLVEAERDYVRLHVGTRSYLLRGTIADLETRLGNETFVRVHRSVIVPRRRIRSLQRSAGGTWSVALSDGRLVPVGRIFLPRLRATGQG